MKRILKALKAMRLLISNPWKLNLILDQQEIWENLVRKHHGLASLPVIPFPALVKKPVRIDPVSFLDGSALLTDIALLRELASAFQECRYFEIGTWRGESVANVAAVATACYSLNLPDEALYQIIRSDDYVSSHRMFSAGIDRVTHLYGDSRTYDYKGLNMKFDLIFIDGDHHYDSICSDTRNLLEFLCHEDTVMVWHDYAGPPETIRFETLAAILDSCPRELHPFLYQVQHTQCAVLYRKEISSFPFRKFGRPMHQFSVQLNTVPFRST